MQEQIDLSKYEAELLSRAPRISTFLETVGSAALDVSDAIKRRLGDDNLIDEVCTWEQVPQLAFEKRLRSNRRIRMVGAGVILASGVLGVMSFKSLRLAVDNVDIHLFEMPHIIDPYINS